MSRIIKHRIWKIRRLPSAEEMNDKRAEWAEVVLATFCRVAQTDECDALVDLLADLMHWCDRSGSRFNDALRIARMHYKAETSGEEP